MKITQKRTATDPAAFVEELNGTAWGDKTLRVRLVSIDGETKTGRKRFTIEITEE